MSSVPGNRSFFPIDYLIIRTSGEKVPRTGVIHPDSLA